MQADNPFDRKIDAQQAYLPAHVRNAAIDTVAHLDLCWAAIQAVFEDRATPEQAIALVPIVMQRADALRQQARSPSNPHTEDAVAAPAHSAD